MPLRFSLFVLLLLPLGAFAQSGYVITLHLLPGLNYSSVQDPLPRFIRSPPALSPGAELGVMKSFKKYSLGASIGITGFGTRIVAGKTYADGNIISVSQAHGSSAFFASLWAERRLLRLNNTAFSVLAGGMAAYIRESGTAPGSIGTRINLRLVEVSTREGLNLAPLAGIAAAREFRSWMLDIRLCYRFGLREMTTTSFLVRESATAYQGISVNNGSMLLGAIGIGLRI